MKVKETYNDACKHCGATGYVKHYMTGITADSSLTNVCPVCKGSGVVVVTREYEVPDPVEGEVTINTPFSADINPYDLNSVKKHRK